MTVSDVKMSKVLYQAGYQANSKYIERIRRDLGIEPLLRRKRRRTS